MKITADKALEAEANLFAAHLLVPSDLLEREINGLENKAITDKSIKELAKKFDVTIELMMASLIQEGWISIGPIKKR